MFMWHMEFGSSDLVLHSSINQWQHIHEIFIYLFVYFISLVELFFFPLDHVFNEKTSTEAIYNEVAKSIVHSYIEGFNG